MKQHISVEQTNYLIDLGVDANKRSMSINDWDYNCSAYRSVKVFSLADMLEIIPKEIGHEGWQATIEITWFELYKEWSIRYLSIDGQYLKAKRAPELIDALYQMMVQCLKKKDSQITIKFVTQMSLEDQIVEIISQDDLISKYINRNHWISGFSTIVYLITIWTTSKEVVVQVLSGAYRLRHRINRIVLDYPDIFKDGAFCKNDGSCPDTIKFWYK